jgi:hypothetical protein
VSIALAAVWPLAASAYRPFDGTDAAVAAKGEMEIEVGPLGYVAEGSDRTLVAPSLVLNLGVSDGWEVVLEGSNLLKLGSTAGESRMRLEDTGLFLKGLLLEGSLQGKTGLSVATEFGALLPTVRGAPGAGAKWALVVSQRWPDLTVHLNGAAAWTRAHEPAGSGGLIFEGHDEWAVRPVAELLVEGERGSPASISGLLGTIWRASDALSLDAGVRMARARGVNTTEVRFGLTWGFSAGFPR